MTATETDADILTRAADHLDQLRAEATPTPWTVTNLSSRYGGIIGPARRTTRPLELADYGGDLLGESMSSANRALVCALGATAEPLSGWLRACVRRTVIAPVLGVPPHAVAIARAILGEQS